MEFLREKSYWVIYIFHMKSFFVYMLIRFDQSLIEAFIPSVFTECHYLPSMCYRVFWTLGMNEKCWVFFVCFF